MGKEKALLYISRAKVCLSEAQYLCDAGFCIGTIDRSYFSIYNGVQAVLQLQDILVKIRQRPHIQFHQHFIKTGIFDVEIKNILQDVASMRVKGDYEPDHELYEDDAKKALLLARRFYDAIKKYLDAIH